jgi:hypothetical protein
MTVDSKTKLLDPAEIILDHAKQTKSKYTKDQILASIMAESHEAGAILMRQGNTLFIAHPAKNRTAMFRALNADTAQNYLKNSVLFGKAMYMAGYDVMVTEFEDANLMGIFKYVYKHREEISPDVNGKPTMGYAFQNLKGGGYRATIVLGPKREGQA